MTSIIFQQYLDMLSLHIKRKILLIVDNFSAHDLAKESRSFCWRNIEVIFLPPNLTSKYQPLNAGIIAAFKRRYRQKLLHHALSVIDNNKGGLSP